MLTPIMGIIEPGQQKQIDLVMQLTEEEFLVQENLKNKLAIFSLVLDNGVEQENL